MKKFIIYSVLLTIAGGFLLTSCSDDEPSTCNCKRKDPYTGKIDGTLKAQPASYGVTTCTELARLMAELSDGYYYYSCD